MSNETMQGSSSTAPAAVNPSLRLWPGIALVVCMWLIQIWSVTGEFAPIKFFIGKMIAPMATTIGLILWWLFASRLSRFDRLLSVGALATITGATLLIAGNDFPAFPLIIYALPILATAWVVWLLLSIPLQWSVRRVGLICIFVAVGTVCSLLRLDGMNGSFAADFHWRWEPTGEAKMLSELKVAKPAVVVPANVIKDAKLALESTDWPGFRGPKRDGQLHGVSIDTDWARNPPKELWRHRIGPGWSSFAVVGSHVFTQEQRGDEELVVCYDAKTGAEIWSHRDATRFTEIVAGAGPRATPTFHEGRIYALGGNGTLNCLEAVTGKLNWSKDIAADTSAKVPQWGFSSSPLVMDHCVIVFAGGPAGKSLVAYKIDNGDLAWTAGTGKLSYCSPQPATIAAVDQVLFPTEDGLTSFEPATGKVLWLHEWPVPDVARVVQPALVGNDEILIGTGMNIGVRRIGVKKSDDAWSTSEIWTAKDIKPYFNDFVISENHLFGFDGPIFMSVDLEDGKRIWKTRGSGTGYGNGQVLLLAEQKLLLILTESGDVALVEADPKKYREVAKIPAIAGKTWNHPVIANGILFVRNAEEAAAFELKLMSAPLIANDKEMPSEDQSTGETPAEATTESRESER